MKTGKDNSFVFRTRLGWAGVAVSGNGIVRVVLPRRSKRAAEHDLMMVEQKPALLAGSDVLNRAVVLVKRALSGESVYFKLPLDLARSTDFQRAVWKATASIPFGETRSYGWVAKRIGRPTAARAVGQALGANPVPIIVP